eukprot:TRINITY_DN12716_c0_g1_i1.p1 TRINITY_DN12716_c0_g1~~TRINITY_DN12716_c0_g1_i1.p1  ORF type:complete len:318 (+),score=92.67 TRINITY_DN12716_c0_g1_i1:70-1023(+)
MSSIKDKKKNRLQGGGVKKKKVPVKEDAAPSSHWQEHKPDMTKEEQRAKLLPTISGEMEENNLMPKGLCFIEDFITEKEEAELLAFFQNEEWDPDTGLERRTQQWGYAFDYTEMTVVGEGKPMPPILAPIIERMMGVKEESGDKVAKIGRYPYPTPPTQLIVNEYTPGQGIHAHVDRSCFGNCVATLAMGSHCRFILDNAEESNTTLLNDFSKMPAYARTGMQPTTASAKSLFFPRRAIIMMKDDARHTWTHMIPNTTFDEVPATGERLPRTTRVSLTFRTLNKKAMSNVGKKTDYSKAWNGKVPPKKEETPPKKEE